MKTRAEHRAILSGAAGIMLAVLYSFGETPEAPKPPTEGPLSNSPPPGISLPNTGIKGVPLSGIPDSAIPFSPTPLPAGEASEAAATLVVFNSNDPDSGDLAHFYAEKRGIPKEQVLGLPCARGEEIGRAEYDLFIARPLRKAFDDNHWWEVRKEDDNREGMVVSNHIRFVALIRGMPLKIVARAITRATRPSGRRPCRRTTRPRSIRNWRCSAWADTRFPVCCPTRTSEASRASRMQSSRR